MVNQFGNRGPASDCQFTGHYSMILPKRFVFVAAESDLFAAVELAVPSAVAFFEKGLRVVSSSKGKLTAKLRTNQVCGP